jgi:chromosome segregation ATPase
MSASPIRDADGKLAITPGVWQLSQHGVHIDQPAFRSVKECGPASWNSAVQTSKQRMADAALIAEAGTVTNQTGRTPAELRDERDAYKREVEVMQMERPSLDVAQRKISELAELLRERDGWEAEATRLKDELDEIKESFAATVRGDCFGDEKHCACVPALREEITRLRDLCRELREALEEIVAQYDWQARTVSECEAMELANEALSKSEGV